MKITIVGTGNGGTTVAADLSLKGHHVTLLKTSDQLHNENFNYLRKTRQVEFEDTDRTRTAKLAQVTTDFAEAIPGAELIIVYIWTNFHKAIIDRMLPYIQDGQCFLLEPGYLSTCYFMQATDKDITVIEAESSPIDCRIDKPGKVRALFRNVMNPFGVYPKAKREKAKQVLDALGYPYMLTDSVIEAALHNPNLIVHTIGAIFSIPRIEYTNGQYWMYKEVFTPHIWNIVRSLDTEKMDVLERLGSKRLPYVEACKLRNSEDQKGNAKAAFFHYAKHSSPKGPHQPDSRYITEDVPEGLVMLESLGQTLDIPTPTCSGLINVASAAMEIDFRKNGRTVERLGYANIQKILQDAAS
ncbi:MAG TPA: NAD/NADP octopine/nopaline dehydrogenase family protein [Candidatus Limiplasma sp.]|nr:NAD/NADP octopine/nopaline dehydrogenase family protein [Candidatus Limiplasma sp.]HRX08141.1 NAD/NADP octopine/nopaline dehydrogenase family protein [Candidatus Limiplasma sp.]